MPPAANAVTRDECHGGRTSNPAEKLFPNIAKDGPERDEKDWEDCADHQDLKHGLPLQNPEQPHKPGRLQDRSALQPDTCTCVLIS